jgi:hypothetical protein
VLAHGIAEGQWFIEGNKRAALAALHTFLLVNGLHFVPRRRNGLVGYWISPRPPGQLRRKSGNLEHGSVNRRFRILT